MAVSEVNCNLKAGKILPLTVIPWIENRTTAVRTCVDMTASAVHWSVDGEKFGLPTISMIVEKLGPGYVIVKMDLQDMFLSWKLHPERWVLFGFRHPITSQSYVYPVLPFGFTLSLLIACRNTQLMADLIEAEMEALWTGLPGNPCLVQVERLAPVPAPTPRPKPA
eukprot:2614199-Rhodomonas_salina.1